MTVTETQPAEVGSNEPDRTYDPGVGLLADALAHVQAELPAVVAREVAKVTGETKQGNPVSYSYKYAGLATVAATILPLLGKYGLSFTTWPTIISNRFVLRYELLHASGQRLGGLYPLSEDVRSPQAMGSQITYARRYCLCAVTGIAPEDDDDAAAAEADRAAQRADRQAQAAEQTALEQEQAAAELAHAVDAVRGAWAIQYGEFSQDQAAELYRTWSKGGTLTTATAGQLRTFAAYITNLPTADAGGDPTTPPPATDPEADHDLSGAQRGKIFALFEDLGLKSNRSAQLEYLSSVTGRAIKSRGDLRASDADAVIKALEADVAEARRTGLATTQPGSESDAAAQSAAGETRVPADSEPAR